PGPARVEAAGMTVVARRGRWGGGPVGGGAGGALWAAAPSVPRICTPPRAYHGRVRALARVESAGVPGSWGWLAGRGVQRRGGGVRRGCGVVRVCRCSRVGTANLNAALVLPCAALGPGSRGGCRGDGRGVAVWVTRCAAVGVRR